MQHNNRIVYLCRYTSPTLPQHVAWSCSADGFFLSNHFGIETSKSRVAKFRTLPFNRTTAEEILSVGERIDQRQPDEEIALRKDVTAHGNENESDFSV